MDPTDIEAVLEGQYIDNSTSDSVMVLSKDGNIIQYVHQSLAIQAKRKFNIWIISCSENEDIMEKPRISDPLRHFYWPLYCLVINDLRDQIYLAEGGQTLWFFH